MFSSNLTAPPAYSTHLLRIPINPRDSFREKKSIAHFLANNHVKCNTRFFQHRLISALREQPMPNRGSQIPLAANQQKCVVHFFVSANQEKQVNKKFSQIIVIATKKRISPL